MTSNGDGNQSSHLPERSAIFVYGTLKRGFKNYTSCLEDPIRRGVAEFVDIAVTTESWPLFTDAYGISYVPNFPGEGLPIAGEAFHVDEETLRVLDRLEGHPERYTRTEVTARNASGETRTVWIYLLKNQTREKLSQFAFINEYTLEYHMANYVLPSERKPDGFVKHAWGGYE